MKQFLAIFGILLLGAFIGMYMNNLYHCQSEYHIQLLDYDQVEMMDQNHKLIRTTTLDSLSYHLIQDNI
jgi:hypothetical protein